MSIKTSLEIKKYEIFSHNKLFNIKFTFNRNGELKKLLDGLAMEEYYFGSNAITNHSNNYDEVLEDYKALATKLSNRYKGQVELIQKSESLFEFIGQQIPIQEIKRIVYTDFCDGIEDDLKIDYA